MYTVQNSDDYMQDKVNLPTVSTSYPAPLPGIYHHLQFLS